MEFNLEERTRRKRWIEYRLGLIEIKKSKWIKGDSSCIRVGRLGRWERDSKRERKIVTIRQTERERESEAVKERD